LKALRDNLATLGFGQVSVRAQAVSAVLAGDPGQGFQIVFADPPYADPIEPVLEQLAAGGWLAPDALICLERATRSGPPAWPGAVSALKSRRYGDSTLWYGRAS
jgi:16S rRNA (guanine966-N2)-methyltransferase